MSKFGKFLLIFLVALLVFGAVGVIVAFALRDSGYDLYVEYNGEKYYGSSAADETFYLSPNAEHKFAVKSLTGGDIDYTVKVVSDGTNNFNFAVDDTLYSFYNGNDELDDYSAVFDLQKIDDGFSISIQQDMTVQSAIGEKFGDSVTFFDELSGNAICFDIVIVTDTGSIVFPFFFAVSITLSPPSIVF